MQSDAQRLRATIGFQQIQGWSELRFAQFYTELRLGMLPATPACINVDTTSEWYVRDVERLAHAQAEEDRRETPARQLLRSIETGRLVDPSDLQIAHLNKVLDWLASRRRRRFSQVWHLGMLIARAYFTCTDCSAIQHWPELGVLPRTALCLIEAFYRSPLTPMAPSLL